MVPSHLFPRRARLLATGVVVVALAMAGCSDDAKPTEPASEPSASERDGGTLVQTWPLTGLKAKGGLPDRPVSVVKVDNTGNARPQVGLDRADLIVEELVEGGLTRLAAFYHSDMSGKVGPVRSMRDTDIGIVKPANGVLVASGGAKQTVRRLRQAGVKMYSETNGNIGLDTDQSRRAPYNQILGLDAFAKKLRKLDREPKAPYLPFGEDSKVKHKKAPKRLSVRFSPTHETIWKRSNGVWVRQNGETASASHEFRADNLLVVSARVESAGYRDPAGNPVPKTVFKGNGKAQLFHGAKKITGTWSKKSPSAPLQLTGKGGKAIQVPPGNTWLELIPKEGGSVRG